MTAPTRVAPALTVEQAERLLQLINAATDAYFAYAHIQGEPTDPDTLDDWMRRSGAAHEAAMDARRAATAAVRELARSPR